MGERRAAPQMSAYAQIANPSSDQRSGAATAPIRVSFADGYLCHRAPGSLRWYQPRGGFGVLYRER
jgi:hypothetical protein